VFSVLQGLIHYEVHHCVAFIPMFHVYFVKMFFSAVVLKQIQCPLLPQYETAWDPHKTS